MAAKAHGRIVAPAAPLVKPRRAKAEAPARPDDVETGRAGSFHLLPFAGCLMMSPAPNPPP
jgi:hypothetical protein